MKSLFFLLAALVLVVTPAAAQDGGVAVLDIDQVAKDLGVEEQVRLALLSIQENLNAELEKAKAQLQQQMDQVEKAAGDAPTEDQQRQIVATNQQLNAEFNRLQREAQQSLAQERVRRITEFRTALEPIALEAAKSQGLSVVLMKITPPVYVFDESSDITAKTLELAREAGMEVENEAPQSGGGEGGKSKE